ncbi:hypothetical protein [Taklimakanibacter lacteus]|uniref:hypothetical protein n=1 Tax=Taklimakanibacter lacteus TaxID=2268456 RepID=UPI0013C3F823
MIALYCGQMVYRSFQPDCETLPELEMFMCRERIIARAMLDITIIGASLISSIILLVGWLISRKPESRKVAP